MLDLYKNLCYEKVRRVAGTNNEDFNSEEDSDDEDDEEDDVDEDGDDKYYQLGTKSKTSFGAASTYSASNGSTNGKKVKFGED